MIERGRREVYNSNAASISDNTVRNATVAQQRTHTHILYMHTYVYTYICLLVESGNSIARLPRLYVPRRWLVFVGVRSIGRLPAYLYTFVCQAVGFLPRTGTRQAATWKSDAATPCRTTPRSLLIFPRLCERATEEGPPARSVLCHVIWKVDNASIRKC